MVLIELDEARGEYGEGRALRIIGNLLDADGKPEQLQNVAIGKRVEVTMVDLGDGWALPQWRLSDEPPRARAMAGAGPGDALGARAIGRQGRGRLGHWARDGSRARARPRPRGREPRSGGALGRTARSGPPGSRGARPRRHRSADRHHGPEQCRALAEQTAQRFGRIDVLINNAAATGHGMPLETIDLDRLRAPIEVNMIGTAAMTQAVIPR